MSSRKITYSLGFLPTYVFIEIIELNVKNFDVDISLPRSASRSKFWMDIIPRHPARFCKNFLSEIKRWNRIFHLNVYITDVPIMTGM